MNDPYAAFSKTPQTNAVMSSTPVPVTQSSAAPATQQSATDRLEQLLKQLQEEQIAPVSASNATAPADSSQDFISALASVPAPPLQSQPDFKSSTPSGTLDGVIKTIGEQFVLGQPSLTELLQLAKKSANSSSAKTVAPASTITSAPTVTPASSVAPSPSPMQFTSPLSDMSQFTAPTYSPATPSVEPKITVMPPAMPVAPAMPTAPTLSPVPAMSPTPSTESAPSNTTPKRRILSQYLTNLATHLEQHGQLHLPSYTKLVPVR